MGLGRGRGLGLGPGRIVSVDLGVTEARPAVRLALLDEGIPRALLARGEERLARHLVRLRVRARTRRLTGGGGVRLTHRVVEGQVTRALRLVAQEARLQPVATVLGVVPVARAERWLLRGVHSTRRPQRSSTPQETQLRAPVKRADAVGQVHLASPAQLVLHRLRRGAVGLLCHDRFVTHDTRSIENFLGLEHLEEAA